MFIDTTEIRDWPSFHRVFSQIFGFPAFYGDNMDALIDCLSYLDEPEAAMTSLHVRPGETLPIQLGAVISFRRRCPDLFQALQDACVFRSRPRTGHLLTAEVKVRNRPTNAYFGNWRTADPGRP